MMISNRASAAASRARRGRLFGFIAVLLLIGVVAFWRAPLSSMLWRVIGPVMLSRNALSPNVAELASTTALLADRNALYAENLDLKARLGRDVGVTRILGGVLLRPPETPYDTLVIDAGFAEGVAMGDLVSAGGTTVVGTITDLYTHTARVTLYSAPGEKYDGLLRGSIPIAVEGQGGGSLRAQLPSGTDVASGDTVSLPGVAGGVAATVSRVERGESESFTTVYLTLPANMWSLRFVEVWKQTRP